MRVLDFCGVFRLGSDGPINVQTKIIKRPNEYGLLAVDDWTLQFERE
jgi:hypothetical protein